jgi:hypothetical protein
MRAAQLPAAAPAKRRHNAANTAVPVVVPGAPPGKPEPDEGADSMSHDAFSAAV